MASEKVVDSSKKLITTKELLQVVLKNFNDKVTREEVQKKIVDSGLSLDGKYLLADIVKKLSFSLKVFENKVLHRIFGPKQDKITEKYRRLYNAKLRSLHPTMGSENKEYEANWVEALRQLAVGLNDDEALKVIAEAKKSMDVAHSKGAFSTENTTTLPKDLNNNVVNTSGGGSFESIRKSDQEEQKKREMELLKIINDLKVEDEPLSPSQSEDITNHEEK